MSVDIRGEIQPEVRVGTGIMVVKDGKILVGTRRGAHAEGLKSFPGGHLDWNETWEECVHRELREECGLDFKVKVRPFDENRLEFFVTNDIMRQYNKHYITIFLVADWVSGEPINNEPDKCDGWDYITFDELADYLSKDQTADWIPLKLLTLHRNRIGI